MYIYMYFYLYPTRFDRQNVYIHIHRRGKTKRISTNENYSILILPAVVPNNGGGICWKCFKLN